MPKPYPSTPRCARCQQPSATAGKSEDRLCTRCKRKVPA